MVLNVIIFHPSLFFLPHQCFPPSFLFTAKLFSSLHFRGPWWLTLLLLLLLSLLWAVFSSSLSPLSMCLSVGHWVLCCPGPLVHVFYGHLSHISFCKNKLYSIYVLPISSLHLSISISCALSLEFVFVLISLRSFWNKCQCSSIIRHVPFCGQLRLSFGTRLCSSASWNQNGHPIFRRYLVDLSS